MAGNIPQMAMNGQMMMLQQQAQQQQAQQQHQQQQQQQHQQQQQPQTQNKQFQTLIYNNLMQSMGLAAANSWQSQVNIGDRFAKTSNLVSNSILAFPNNEWQKICMTAMDFEKKLYLQSPDKQSYEHAMAARIGEMVKRRQGHAPDLQNHVNSDAVRQAQLQAAQQQRQQQQQQQQQMMMNQMAARGLGQPQHGFQPMQNPMQVPVMPQQPQPLGIGMPTAGILQTRPDQRQYQLQQMAQARQPNLFQVDPLAQLNQADKMKVNNVAAKMMSAADETQKNHIRQILQQRMTANQLQEYATQGKDPVFTFYQNSALTQLRASAQRNLLQQQQQQQQQQQHPQQQQRPGMPTNAMPPSTHQGQMNPALMNLGRQSVMPDGQTFAPNMDDIRNEHQMGVRAQLAGQTVVPASTAAGRGVTQGAMAGMPTAGNQQGPNQTPRVPQGQPFGMQPNVDPTAAQVQGPMGVRVVGGRPMPGQAGAMPTPNHPAQASQSPAMNTLTAPMRQPPLNMGQGNVQHAVNQGNQPMAATLNPQFNHQNNTRPVSLQGNMNDPAMAVGMGPNLNTNDAMRNFYAKLQQDRAANNGFQGPKPGLLSGIPGASQPNAMGGPNQAAVLDPNQKGNGAMQSMGQPAAMQQHKQLPANGDQQFFAYAQSPQGRAAMNNMDVPPQILAQFRTMVPAETRRWAQLRQFLHANPNVAPQPLITRLNQLQISQFKQTWDRRPQAAPTGTPQGSNGPVLQQPGSQPQALPPGFSYPPNISQVSRQDIESARRNPQFQNMSDEAVADFVRKFKRDLMARRAWDQYNQAQQRGNMSLPGGPQKPGIPVSQSPASQQGGVTAPPKPSPLMGVQHQAAQPKPVTTPAADAPPAAAKAARPPPPNPSPSTAGKNLKRPHQDDVEDVSGQSSGAAQRPAPQPDARPVPSGSKPTLEQLMKLPPEQLARINPEQLAKLTPEQQRAIAMRIRQVPPAPPETVARLKNLALEGHRLALDELGLQEAQQQGAGIAMSPAALNETRAKIVQASEKLKQIRVGIARWYHQTKDDSRARMYFKIRSKVAKQFADTDRMSQLSDSLTITKEELDPYISMMDSMLQDMEVFKRSAAQEAAGGGAQAATQVPPQPSPLSAANLEKQTQALKQAQNRTAGKTAQAPAAPTTSQPPFQFGAQKSPAGAGNPEYYGEQRVTRNDLVMPARKKAKTAAAHASPPVVQQHTPSSASPQVNVPSPVAVRKPEPPKLTCPEPDCEMNSVGFSTEEARNMHLQEEHIRPYENPQAFVREHMAAAFGLDPQGNPKVVPKSSGPGVSAVSTPAAAPMSLNPSKQGQKPGAPPMSRGGSMQRQGSAAGAKAGETVGTPGRNATAKQGAGTPQIPADDPWTNSTVDPQHLFAGLGPQLDTVNGTFVTDFSMYRSLTPNDTPSSKYSGPSEENSDITEGAMINIDLHLQSLDNEIVYGVDHFGMDNWASPDMNLYTNESMMFPMEDMQTDFSKPFRVNQDLYATDMN